MSRGLFSFEGHKYRTNASDNLAAAEDIEELDGSASYLTALHNWNPGTGIGKVFTCYFS